MANKLSSKQEKQAADNKKVINQSIPAWIQSMNPKTNSATKAALVFVCVWLICGLCLFAFIINTEAAATIIQSIHPSQKTGVGLNDWNN